MEFIDNETILICAFRYALGRKTYIVSHVVEDIINNWDQLSDFFKEKVKKEIREHKEMFGNLGDDCDEEEWNKILNKE